MRFKHFLAVSGLAVLAAGYSTPGALERVYFYYAYRLDEMTGRAKIAPGCGKPGSPCSFDEFVKWIQNDKVATHITDEPFPPIDETAKILSEKGLTGVINIGRVMNGIQNDYTVLLNKVGDVVTGKMEANLNIENPTEAQLKELKDVRLKIMDAVKMVGNARVAATVTSFKPFANFKVVLNAKGDAVDFEKTVEANPGSISRDRLEELWTQHSQGKTATPELLRDFKPQMSFKVIPLPGGGRVDMGSTLKANPGMTRDGLTAQWNLNIEGNHGGNIDALKRTFLNIRQILCPSDRRRWIKRGALACSLNDLLSVDEAVSQGTKLSPEGPELPPTSQEITVAHEAERISNMEFEELMPRFRLATLRKQPSLSLQDLRTKYLGYKPLDPKSPRLRPGSGGSLAMKTFGVAGGAAWVGGVVEAFAHDVGALNRAAVLASIVPLVGCTTSAIAGAQSGEDPVINGVDTALCFLGDALILGGFVPAGVVAQLVRTIIDLFTPLPELPTKEAMQSARDGPWKTFLSDRVYKLIYSHQEFYPEDGFGAKLESALAIEAGAVVSESAQTIGALKASIQSPGVDVDQGQLQTGTEEAVVKVREATPVEIRKRQRHFLLGLPATLRDGNAASFGDLGRDYTRDFVNRITSFENIQRYPDSKFTDFLTPLAGGVGAVANDPYSESSARMREIGQYLQNTPLPMPSLFELAFILGQSKGMKVAPETLSARDYIKQQVPTAPEPTVDIVAIRQTIGISRLMYGQVKEAQLPLDYPADDDQSRHRLQLLLAMRMGALYEQAKVEWSNGQIGQLMTPADYRRVTHPVVPPFPPHPDEVGSIGLMLGLSKAVVEARIQHFRGEEIKAKFRALETMMLSKDFLAAALRPASKTAQSLKMRKRSAVARSVSIHQRRTQTQ
ncbi:heat-labile enterotoxin, A chain [Pochonia chlamydosporia 170]|uniref:Heat-labile enterotoxin, A chain n=1 Tax=Pochonia chlamydosporia 170 TaxID=1380566 RepID=A0A179FHU2_METCM|nr:heat-labile enterotoxin, A chain [Pochonia chlamydosporia 170]OAQ64838.1 heat-labile enterotoxin, A chain [Pochonia chlamydosporia 170]